MKILSHLALFAVLACEANAADIANSTSFGRGYALPQTPSVRPARGVFHPRQVISQRNMQRSGNASGGTKRHRSERIYEYAKLGAAVVVGVAAGVGIGQVVGPLWRKRVIAPSEAVSDNNKDQSNPPPSGTPAESPRTISLREPLVPRASYRSHRTTASPGACASPKRQCSMQRKSDFLHAQNNFPAQNGPDESTAYDAWVLLGDEEAPPGNIGRAMSATHADRREALWLPRAVGSEPAGDLSLRDTLEVENGEETPANEDIPIDDDASPNLEDDNNKRPAPRSVPPPITVTAPSPVSTRLPLRSNCQGKYKLVDLNPYRPPVSSSSPSSPPRLPVENGDLRGRAQIRSSSCTENASVSRHTSLSAGTIRAASKQRNNVDDETTTEGSDGVLLHCSSNDFSNNNHHSSMGSSEILSSRSEPLPVSASNGMVGSETAADDDDGDDAIACNTGISLSAPVHRRRNRSCSENECLADIREVSLEATPARVDSMLNVLGDETYVDPHVPDPEEIAEELWNTSNIESSEIANSNGNLANGFSVNNNDDSQSNDGYEVYRKIKRTNTG